MKKILSLTALCIIMCIFYWACKKDQTTLNKYLTTEEQELIGNAKTYFETNVQNTIQGKRLSDVTDTTSGQFNPLRSLLKSADWSNAYTIKLSIGKIVVAPIKFGDSLYTRPPNTDSTTRLSVNNLVKLIVYKDSAKQLHVEVVTSFPDSNFLNNPTGTFSGIAFVQDWQGNYLRSFGYQNGQIFQLKLNDSTQQQTISTSAVVRPDMQMAPPTYNNDCASIGWFASDDGYDEDDGYSSGAGCIDLSGGGGGESSSGSGAPSSGDYGGIAGTGGSVIPSKPITVANANVTIDNIANNLKDPCLLNIYNRITKPGVTTFINQLFDKAFISYGQDLNIEFDEDNTLTYPNSQPEISQSVERRNTKTWVIKINPTFVNTSSEEFIGAAIIHEMVHSFIALYQEYNPANGDFSDPGTHTAMLNSWINNMKQLLINSFGISSTDATAICLEGISDVLVDNNLTPLPAIDTFLQTNYNTTVEAAHAIASQYEEGTKGTRCP